MNEEKIINAVEGGRDMIENYLHEWPLKIVKKCTL